MVCTKNCNCGLWFGCHGTGYHSNVTTPAPFWMIYCGFNLAGGKRHFQALGTAVGLGWEQNKVFGFIIKEGLAKENVTTI